jgi:hypothetical protein
MSAVIEWPVGSTRWRMVVLVACAGVLLCACPVVA